MSINIQREFIVGDHWLYYKIYSGTKTADSILIEIIKPIVSDLINKNIISKWFFIRYGDPKPHLRIRFYCKDLNNIGTVINTLLPLFKDLMNQDLIWKIQTDTYQRELERYGKNSMELSESMFFYDSKLILDLLEIVGDDDELRWLIALKIIENIMNAFNYTIDNKLVFFERLKVGFGSEFGINKDLNKQIDYKYRNYRNTIEEIIEAKKGSASQYDELLIALEDFNNKSRSTVDEILNFRESGILMLSLDSLISSYIHMSMVRLFKSKNRIHELVVYDFMYRYYKSYRARFYKEFVD